MSNTDQKPTQEPQGAQGIGGSASVKIDHPQFAAPKAEDKFSLAVPATVVKLDGDN